MENSLRINNKVVLKNFLKLQIILFILITSEISAQQVVVNLQAPPPYQMRIEDMWNLVLVNQGEPTEIYLHANAIELNSGLIVDVTSSVFILPRGSKRIRSGDVGTVTVNQKNQNYTSVINRLSAVPNGNYEICVEVVRSSDGFILGSGCIEQEVLNLSQVELLYPEDKSVLNPFEDYDDSDQNALTLRGIEKKDIRRGMVLARTNSNQDSSDADTTEYSQTLRGIEKKDIRRGMVIAKPGSIKPHSRMMSSSIVFSWLPPTPVPNNVQINYRIKIVELYGNQSPYDAMQSNPLFFSASGIFTTSFQYPLAAREFNPERVYAWQVEAYANGFLLSSSEINSFSFLPDFDTKRTINDSKRSSLNIIRASNSIIEDLPGGLKTLSKNYSNSNSLSFKNTNIVQNFNLLSIPNLISNFLNDNEPKAISFGLTGELFGETSNRKGSGSDKKPSYGYLQLTPSVNLYGIPFGLNLLLSSENSSQRQNINSFSFLYSVDAAKEMIQNKIENEGEESVPGLMKFFSYFHSFGIGTNYPSYSQYTMQGVPVSGLSFEFNPGWFYLATALQKNQKPIDNSAFRRDLYSGRIGFGQKDDNHLFFTGIYANDNASSIIIDSLNRNLSPNSNYVFGVEGKINLFEDKLSFDGEIAGAMLTRDNRDPDLVNEDIPQFVRNIFQPKISSQVDYAYSLNTTFDNSESNTKVSAGVRMIGPGYKSLGNPTLRNDKFEVSGKIEQKFVERQISVSLSMKYYRDNLINSKLFTTTTYSPGIKLGLKFKNYPFLNLSYYPSFLKNDATDPLKKVDFKNHLFTAVTGYNQKISDMMLSSNVFYMFNKSKSLDSLSGYTSNNFVITENLTFKSPLVLSAGFGMNFLNFADFSTRITNLDGSIGYTFFEQWNNTFGVNYSVEKNKSNRVGFYINSSYSLSEQVSIDLRVEKNNYSDQLLSSNDYDEIIARTTLRIIL